MTLMLKILSKEIPFILVGNFEVLQDEMHQYETRLVASYTPPALCSNKNFYQNSFMPWTSRNL